MESTALEPHHAAHGAVLADDRGVQLPRHFGDPAGEYHALREGAAVIDLGFRALVRATGPDRVAFLQGMLTQDVARLVPGEGCGALLLTIQGRVVADVRVAAAADALWLDVDRRARAAFVDALEQLIIADDVTLDAPPVPTTVLAVEGPRAATIVGDAADALGPYAHRPLSLAGIPIVAQRASEVRGPGFVLHVPSAGAAAVWDHCVAAGARPCGMDALEGRRIEVGVPRILVDMDVHCLALEVPVEDLLSQTKGCYLGQEVVARGTARGHVNRRLLGLVLDGPLPPPGAALEREGKDVGRLTTVGQAPGLRRGAALGFVRREHAAPGTVLGVPHGHATTLATVAAWPLA